MKKKKIQRIALAAIIAAVVVGIVIYNYNIDQIKAKGFTFGNELQLIQNDVTKLQTFFSSKIVQWEEGDLTKAELLEYAENHVSEMEKIIPRYDKLVPPEPYVSSVDLFRLSTESQIESDKEYIKWIETDDEAYKVRSDALIQEALQYELAALADYKEAQLGLKP